MLYYMFKIFKKQEQFMKITKYFLLKLVNKQTTVQNQVINLMNEIAIWKKQSCDDEYS